MNVFIKQFDQNIKSSYRCYDRVILRGYIRWMFSISCIVYFLRQKGFRKISNGVMRIFTDQLNAHLEKQAKKYGVPILWWPSVNGGTDGAKLRYVEENYTQNNTKKGNKVYCIISNPEYAQSYTTRHLVTKNGKPYEKMYRCRKQVKHYYIYFHDELLGGPCYLKLSTYFPFQAEFYFNGHNAIQQKLDKEGVSYRKEGNAFVAIEDPKKVQEIAYSLTGKEVQERINYWMKHFFRFDKGRYSTVPQEFHHEWYCSQVEVSTNIIFKSARFCTGLFERILDKFSRIGLPDSLSQIFGKRRCRKESKSTRRLYENKACMKSWLGRNSIKLYNKLGYFLRIETTINDPKSLGLNKPVIYLRQYLSYGAKCNERMMACFADVDTITLPAETRDECNHPVTGKNGHSIAALDLRKSRQLSLFGELLKPKYTVAGFTTRTLLQMLSEHFDNLGQIRYELGKLRARGLLEKHKGKSLWRVTRKGFQMLWVKVAANSIFEAPMIAMSYNDSSSKSVSQPSRLEEAHQSIHNGLSLIFQEVSMAATN